MRRLMLIALPALLFPRLALAADPDVPVTAQAPMTSSGFAGGSRGNESSDLPAPDTTALVNRPLLITSSIVLVASYVPMAAIAYTSDRPSVPAGAWLSSDNTTVTLPDVTIAYFYLLCQTKLIVPKNKAGSQGLRLADAASPKFPAPSPC